MFGRRIVNLGQITKIFEPSKAQILKTVFLDSESSGDVNQHLARVLADVDPRLLQIVMGRLILERYPGLNLSPNEKELLNRFFSDGIQAKFCENACEDLIHSKREIWFAHSIRKQLPHLPAHLPVVAVIGNNHLHGTLEQLEAQCGHPVVKNQRKVADRYRNVTKIPISERAAFGNHFYLEQHLIKQSTCQKMIKAVRGLLCNQNGLRSNPTAVDIKFLRN